MTRVRSTLAAWLILAGVMVTPVQGVQATTSPDSVRRAWPGSVAATHWSRAALQRLAAYGLVAPADATPAWPAPRASIRRLLANAAASAERTREPAVAALAASYLERFDREFHAGHTLGPLRGNASVSAGAFAHDGTVFAGSAVPSPDGYDYTGARPRADSARFVVGWDVAADLGGLAELEVNGSTRGDLGGHLGRRFGPVFVWLGRRALAVGPSAYGGIVLGGNVAFTGLGLDLPDGIRLPGFLRALGPFRYTQTLARMDRSGAVVHPWFLAQRISVAPWNDFVIAVNRAAIFGGRGNLELTPGRLFWFLVGQTDVPGKDSDFENQIVSAEFTWSSRRPVPLVLYIEYGFDDAGGAFYRVPAVLAGAQFENLPALPDALAIGAEMAAFEESCCGHPPWYFHGALPDGWTDRGGLLGHPLAGHGIEAALTWRVDLPAPALLMSGRAWIRHRSAENLHAPAHQGRSTGGRLTALFHLASASRIEAVLDGENGTGWSAWSGRLLWTYTF